MHIFFCYSIGMLILLSLLQTSQIVTQSLMMQQKRGWWFSQTSTGVPCIRIIWDTSFKMCIYGPASAWVNGNLWIGDPRIWISTCTVLAENVWDNLEGNLQTLWTQVTWLWNRQADILIQDYLTSSLRWLHSSNCQWQSRHFHLPLPSAIHTL